MWRERLELKVRVNVREQVKVKAEAEEEEEEEGEDAQREPAARWGSGETTSRDSINFGNGRV
jgi:hypothetical protein